MSFAAQLPHRLEHFGHAPAIGRMIVAQAAAHSARGGNFLLSAQCSIR
jgi:hypothetical protein